MPKQDQHAWFERATSRQCRLRMMDGVEAYLHSIGQSYEDWHIDLARNFVSNFRYDVGIDVAESHGVWHAVVIDHPRFGQRLTRKQKWHLRRTAIAIYRRRKAAARAAALSFPHQYPMEINT